MIISIKMTEFVKDSFRSNDEKKTETEVIAFDASKICSVLCDLYAIVKNAAVDTIERVEILI